MKLSNLNLDLNIIFDLFAYNVSGIAEGGAIELLQSGLRYEA